MFHRVHPLAGQGFNLILRDIEKLNELISNNLRLGLTLKDSNIPKDLSDSRKPENLLMGLGIDTTRKFFKSNKYLDPIKENILNNFIKLLISVSIIYILGVFWLGSLIGWDKPIIQLGVTPFLLAEMFKIVILTLLAKNILRAETAAVAALTLVNYHLNLS